VAKDGQVKRNNIIIQYIDYTETLNVKSQDIDEVIQYSFSKRPSQILSIILNGKMIYAKTG